MLLSILAALAVTALIFSGCKKSEPAPAKPPEKKAAPAPAEKPAPTPAEKPAEK